jgi:UDP-glucose 4-epimerase
MAEENTSIGLAATRRDSRQSGRSQNQFMNILITGGAGFIGSHVAAFHLKRGDEVVAVDDLSTGSPANLEAFKSHPRFRFVHADLLEWPGLAGAVKVADRIYHLAAVVGMFRVLKDPVRITKVNVGATEALLEAAATSGHLPQVVIASSSSVYGHSEAKELGEEDDVVFTPHDGGLTGYGLSKLVNEIQAHAYCESFGLPIAVARLFNAAGPRQTGTYGFVVPRFVQEAVNGEPLTVFGDGTQTRSFCDVRDTVAALDLLAGCPAAYGVPVNVGTTREISILDLAKLVMERTGSNSEISFIPFEEAYGAHFEHIMRRRPVITRLQALTGFRPRFTLENTIDDLVAPRRSEPLHAHA